MKWVALTTGSFQRVDTSQDHSNDSPKKPRSSYSPATDMTRRYVLALSLVALLSGAAYLTLRWVIVSQETFSSIINVSGRQRMLSQRIALFSSLLIEASETDADRVREELRQAVSLMETSHRGLTAGDPALGLPASMSDEVQAMYFGQSLALDQQVREYLAHVRSLLSAQDNELTLTNSDLQHILATGPGVLLQSLDAMTSQYEKEAKSSSVQLKQLETWVLLVTLMTLVLEALLIFRPMGRRIEEDRLELLSSQEQLEHMAYHDSLTCLPNRMLFRDRLEHSLAHARRYRCRIAVFQLDLDNFKDVNDTLGHPAGDVLLKDVAARLKETLREHDTVARLGGDEFGVILLGVTSPDVVSELAERIRTVISEPFILEGKEVYSTTSIGITVFPDDAQEPGQLLKNADIALYRAKDADGACHRFFAPAMKAGVEGRKAHEAALRTALVRDELIVHYQPQIRLSNGSLTGLEVLARLQRPDRSTVQVGEFLETAETSGLIVPIGERVLRQACTQARAWLDEGIAPLRICVNLSPVQFRQRDLAEIISGILEETGVDPNTLEVEVTEGTVLSEEGGHVYSTLERLHRLGVSISLDDFGTGYASLTHLRQWPVDRLKIDRSFVRNMENDAEDAAIVQLIIHLGHRLGMEVVAEGVETPGQSDFLKKHGCDLAQGYLYARPLPGDSISRLLPTYS